MTKTFLTVLDGSGIPPDESMTPGNARAGVASAQRSVPVDLTGGGYTISLDIVRPAASRQIVPVFMYVHGGDWVLATRFGVLTIHLPPLRERDEDLPTLALQSVRR